MSEEDVLSRHEEQLMSGEEVLSRHEEQLMSEEDVVSRRAGGLSRAEATPSKGERADFPREAARSTS
jgi:hypothetical protein